MLSSIHKRGVGKAAVPTVALCALVALLAMWVSASATAADICPNAALRAAQSASYLPDCRAYELTSPTDKNGGSVATEKGLTQSAVDGDAIKWTSIAAFGDVLGIEVRGVEYLSSRHGSEGWVTHAINPPQESTGVIFDSSQYQELSPDLTKGVYLALTPLDNSHPNVARVPNLYLRTDLRSAPGSYELMTDAVAPLTPFGRTNSEPEMDVAAVSADWSRILFESAYDLTANAAGTDPELPKLYEWHNGVVSLVGILPDGTVAAGSAAGEGAGVGNWGGWTYDAMSSDGSRIVFTAGPFSSGHEWGKVGNLYMRIDGKETIQLNASERAEPDPKGFKFAFFSRATPDDSQVFFGSQQALTDDATSGEIHVYRYDLNAPAGKHLTLLAQAVPNRSPEAYSSVNAVSADGSYVYLTLNGEVRPGDPEEGGLYVWHNGTLRFLAPRSSVTGEIEQWGDNGRSSQSYGFRVTPDGKTIAFVDASISLAQSLGYDNEHERQEIYVYNYDSEKLTCVSCDSSGAPPLGDATFTAPELIERYDANVAASLIPKNMYRPHALSEDGRFVFFDTPDPLTVDDSNGKRDVYEYDSSTGRVELISGGTCNCDSTFMDATPDGSNVFFTTHQPLVRADIDTAGDMYDARVGGGIVKQNESPPLPCEGDDCQGPAKAIPVFSAPTSANFSGDGNPVIVTQSPPRPHRLTRAQKFARALRACHAKRGKRRSNCEASARKKYGTARRSGKRASRRAGR